MKNVLDDAKYNIKPLVPSNTNIKPDPVTSTKIIDFEVIN